MHGTIMEMPIRRKEPLLGPNPNYSRALYTDPPSHDFCSWLMIAEMMRRHHQSPEPLHVRFGLIDGQLGTVDFSHFGLASGRCYPCGVSREYHDTMMANVLLPAMAMIGAVEETPALDLGGGPKVIDMPDHYVEYDYHVSGLVDASRSGLIVPRWTVPQWAHDEVSAFLGSRRPVVITLREVQLQPQRNSQIEEWLRFADSIIGDYEVLFIRDTCKSDQTRALAPFPTWPRASTNVYVRAALAQRAFVNMMVGTGPFMWCSFSNAPYLVFKQLVPALPNWDHGQAKGWREQAHMEIGDQFPWALPMQRLTWADDTFENISREFHEFVNSGVSHQVKGAA